MISGLHRDRRQARRLVDARNGDRQAFRDLYAELYPMVRAFVSRRIRSPADTDDVTAHAFLQMVRRLDDFDPARGSVTGWLFAIVRSAVADHYRGRTPEVPLEDEPSGSAELAVDPSEELWLRQHAALLRKMLARYPAATREMVRLRLEHELSFREIAEALGFEPAMVRKRVSRCLREIEAEARGLEGASDD